MSESSPAPCPACGSRDTSVFHRQSGAPVNSCLLVDTESEALGFPRGELEIAVCHGCGFVFNAAFDTGLSEYSDRYEETQGFSPRFREFATTLAQRWIDKYDIRDRDVLEIGCGKGEFLALMCELGNNRGIGVDPSAIPDRLRSSAEVRLIPEFFGPQHADLPADVIVCRHTLEHIAPVAEFLRGVRTAIGDRLDTIVLFELPDVLRVLREGAFWDMYYEHCSYFSPGSLARLFRAEGFEVVDVELDYDDQYILIEARPASGAVTGSALPLEETAADVVATCEDFAATFAKTVEVWRSAVLGAADGGQRPVIWGGGSKGVAYLTTLALHEQVHYAVDINPYKQGKYIAGSGQQVVGPDFLRDYQPGLVIAMNPVYVNEIQTTLDELGVTAELTAV